MWTIFKIFIEFVIILFLFYVLFFGPKAWGISAPPPGIQPGLPSIGRQRLFFLEGKVLTTGPLGKSFGKQLFLFARNFWKWRVELKIEWKKKKENRMDPMWRRIIWGNFCFWWICMCVCLHPYASLCIWTVSLWVLVLKTEKNTSLKRSHCFQGQIAGSWSEQDEKSV